MRACPRFRANPRAGWALSLVALLYASLLGQHGVAVEPKSAAAGAADGGEVCDAPSAAECGRVVEDAEFGAAADVAAGAGVAGVVAAAAVAIENGVDGHAGDERLAQGCQRRGCR